MEPIVPPNPPCGHNWRDSLKLIGELCELAFDRSLDDADRARRLRDAIREHEGEFDDHDDE